MRISLKDLLAIVAFCAALLGCASYAGFDNGLFWFGVGSSVVLSVLFVVLGTRVRRRGNASALALFFGLIGMIFFFHHFIHQRTDFVLRRISCSWPTTPAVMESLKSICNRCPARRDGLWTYPWNS
jgi:hypothetical protein